MSSRIRKYFISVMLVLLTGGLLIGAGPIYRALKTWRARGFAHEAAQLIEEQRWADAFQKARAAYQLNPLEPNTLRSLARLNTLFGQRHALGFWEQLVRSDHATDQDRRELVKIALQLNEIDRAQAEMDFLLKSNSSEPANLQLAAELALLQNDLEGAIAYAREMLQTDPRAQHQLLLAKLLLRSPALYDQQEGKQILLRIAGDHSSEPDGLHALALAAKGAPLSRTESGTVSHALRMHPLASTEHQLLALELEIKMNIAREPELVGGTIQDFKGRTAVERLQLARWLNANKQPAQTLQLIASSEALEHQDFLLVRADALALLGRWGELRATFEAEELPVPDLLRQLYLARIFAEVGALSEAALAWRRVHLETGNSPIALLYTARYAEKTGNLEQAAKAYRRLTGNPGWARQAYTSLIRLAEEEGDTRALRGLIREFLERFPQETRARNDLAYLNLLLGEHTKAALESGQDLFAAQPAFLAHRTTLALAHFRQNDPSSARELYEGLRVNWSLAPAGWQAVHAAVRGANGENHLARALARQIPLAQLKEEERALIEPWLQSSSSNF